MARGRVRRVDDDDIARLVWKINLRSVVVVFVVFVTAATIANDDLHPVIIGN